MRVQFKHAQISKWEEVSVGAIRKVEEMISFIIYVLDEHMEIQRSWLKQREYINRW